MMDTSPPTWQARAAARPGIVRAAAGDAYRPSARSLSALGLRRAASCAAQAKMRAQRHEPPIARFLARS
jgi:hypothetical protein